MEEVHSKEKAGMEEKIKKLEKSHLVEVKEELPDSAEDLSNFVSTFFQHFSVFAMSVILCFHIIK